MAVVCDKQSFMVVLGKETVIVVETDEISLEQLGESEFILDDLPGVVENNRKHSRIGNGIL